MLEANLTRYVFFWVGCLYYLLSSFLHSPACVYARVFHIMVERGNFFFFLSQCVLTCLLFPHPCLCLPTSAQVVCCRKYDTRNALKRDRCVSSWKHIQMSTKQGPGLEAEHCLLLVRQGAICHNQATKGNYLHETRAVSGGKKRGGGSIF